MARSKEILLLIVSFFLVCSASGQEIKEKIALKSVLEQISRSHRIKFSYIEEEIAVYKLEPPSSKLTLQEKIEYLRQNTKLHFRKISDGNYAVFNDQKMEKPLCGFLRDADTHQPVENAFLSLENTNVSTTSDAKGYFELPVLSPNNIIIQHLNYETASIDPAKIYVENCPEIALIPVYQQLEQVVAQRYLATGITKNPGGSYEVKPTKFGILPGLTEPDVLQTMQQIPGIYSADETISNINVRGGTHDQNLFLWNGIRMFQTGHFFGLISGFNPLLAHSISITKNGSSAFYGESVSSVVDISSASGDTPRRSAINANMISIEGYTKVRLSKNSNVEISARRSLTDFFYSPAYSKYSDRIFHNTVITDFGSSTPVSYKSDERFYFYDLTAHYTQKIGKRHQLAAGVIAIRNSLDVDRFDENESRNSNLGQQNFGADLSWKSDWTDRSSTSARYYVSRYNLDSSNNEPASNQSVFQTNSVLDMAAELKHTIKKGSYALSAGYQIEETKVTNSDSINVPAFKRSVTEELLTHALILEATYKNPESKFFATGGIRANYFSQFRLYLVEPRLQFGYKLSKLWKVEVQGEQKSHSLSQIIDLQNDFLGIEKRRWTLANEQDVPVQISRQISIGVEYRSRGWLFTWENFYKFVEGITSSSQAFQNQFEFVRATGDYRVYGSELLLQKSFRRFYTWLSYSINDNKYFFDAFSNEAFPNNFEAKHAVSWAGIYEWQNLKVAIGSKWRSGRPLTTPASDELDTTFPSDPRIIYNSPNNSRLPNFFQLNFSASKSWKLKGHAELQTGFSIINLLDSKVVINRYYRVNAAGDGIQTVDTYSLGLTPNVNIKITL